MTDASRQEIIIGNWKMYHTVDSSLAFLKAFIPLVQHTPVEIYLAVPFTSIGPMAELAKDTRICIGAQNMHDASQGAFTGEIAAKMLLEIGARFVIIGHSERRRLFHEDNAFINRKMRRALIDGIQPVLCIGETLEERENGQTEQVIRTQLTECLADLPLDKLPNAILAYEPVWAIGTHQPATPEMAQAVHHQCRTLLTEICGDDVAQKMPILYGGSIKPDNAATFLDQIDVDGLLVGGASLTPETFSQIVNCRSPSEMKSQKE